MERIPVFEPHLGPDAREHLLEALDVGWLGMGATTQEFEQRIADFLGLDGRYVCATNTGTSALHIALRAAGIGDGDEVITPSFNYVADHQAVRMTGAEVAMCDIREGDLGIDVDKAAELINEKTRAIIPLHFAGLPCDSAGVYELAEKRGLRVIEDGMHAFGTNIDGEKIGSNGDITCFSFDPVKIITSIDGGCVVVNSEEGHDRALQKPARLGIRRGLGGLSQSPDQHHGQHRRIADQANRRIHRKPPVGLQGLQRSIRQPRRIDRPANDIRRCIAIHLQPAHTCRSS
jgi:dTDP-4-amino-4,6-dideoxygalactose transaminase